MTASGCGIYDNSSDAAVLYACGSSIVTSSVILVNGGISISGSSTVNPTPTARAGGVADPLAALPAPAVGACNSLTSGGGGYSLSHSQTATLNPGVYCGGISVTGAAIATLSPGAYILNGGGLHVRQFRPTLGHGSDFLQYRAGRLHCRAPSRQPGRRCCESFGPERPARIRKYFFTRPHHNLRRGQFLRQLGERTTSGTLYFPTTAVTYTGNVGAAIYDAFVFSTLSINGRSSLKNDTSGTYMGLAKPQASLIESPYSKSGRMLPWPKR